MIENIIALLVCGIVGEITCIIAELKLIKKLREK